GTSKHYRNRPTQDVEVEPWRPVAHVLDIDTHAPFEARRVSLGHLPIARDTRLDPKHHTLRLFHLGNFTRELGAGTYQAHFAHQDVPNLRQLVQAILPQQAAHAGHARIVGELVKLLVFGFQLRILIQNLLQPALSVPVHRPELECLEPYAVLA